MNVGVAVGSRSRTDTSGTGKRSCPGRASPSTNVALAPTFVGRRPRVCGRTV
ncbi:MAG: hypothetical protein U0470_07760 [Anaerolineae bacterium]